MQTKRARLNIPQGCTSIELRRASRGRLKLNGVDDLGGAEADSADALASGTIDCELEVIPAIAAVSYIDYVMIQSSLFNNVHI